MSRVLMVDNAALFRMLDASFLRRAGWDIATARTQLLPRCCWTSHTSESWPSRRISTALKMAGSLPAGNSMSTTGPVIWITRPFADAAAVAILVSAS